MQDGELFEAVAQALSNRFFGKYRGKVVGNTDKQGRGRIQVLVPELFGENTPRWALPSAPCAGPDVGFFAVPPVHANVWVEFEAGNLNHPIWSGCFWSEGDLAQADADPQVVWIKTPIGSIRIDGAESMITIETADGARVSVGGGEIKLEGWKILSDAQGSTTELTAASFDAKKGALKVL